ncbi:MAG: hypothetical protein JKY56_16625 [Kofleriaceae bacterium]|nr:hypothetical protein [Kofleriaceae bacterium]
MAQSSVLQIDVGSSKVKTGPNLRNGSGVRWLVDPIAQTLEVSRLEGASGLLAASFGGSSAVGRAI